MCIMIMNQSLIDSRYQHNRGYILPEYKGYNTVIDDGYTTIYDTG